jgi:hypothetical protein
MGVFWSRVIRKFSVIFIFPSTGGLGRHILRVEENVGKYWSALVATAVVWGSGQI